MHRIAVIGANAAGLATVFGLRAACHDGVLVDEEGRSRGSRLWAAGDVARYVGGPFRGRRFEQQQSAEAQGRRVASALAGLAPAPWKTPYLWPDQAETTLQAVGEISQVEDPVYRIDPRGGGLCAFYLRDARLVGVAALGWAREFAAARRLLAAGQCPDPLALADPGRPLADLFAANPRPPALRIRTWRTPSSLSTTSSPARRGASCSRDPRRWCAWPWRRDAQISQRG